MQTTEERAVYQINNGFNLKNLKWRFLDCPFDFSNVYSHLPYVFIKVTIWTHLSTVWPLKIEKIVTIRQHIKFDIPKIFNLFYFIIPNIVTLI